MGASLTELVGSFGLHLRAMNRRPKTVVSYTEAVNGLAAFLQGAGVSTEVDKLRKRDIEAYIADQLTRRAPKTASNRYRSLQQFFRWCEEEEEISSSPMAGMRGPKVPERPVPVPKLTTLRAVLGVCSGTGFNARRDTAILMLFCDTGARLSEIAGLRLQDVDLLRDGHGTLWVMGKGDRLRQVPLDAVAVKALDRYLRRRKEHPKAHLEWLWLGQKGRYTHSGIGQMVRARARKASESLHAHQLRHFFAHQWLAHGGNETELMRVGAFVDSTPVCSVSLIEHNMDTYQELTPWLAAPFVLPSHRGHGIGTALVSGARKKHGRRGRTAPVPLHLASEGFYARLGWSTYAEDVHEGEPVTSWFVKRS